MTPLFSLKSFLLSTATVMLERAAPTQKVQRPSRDELLETGDRLWAGERGERNRRILLQRRDGPYERRYHATKGWRVRRVAA